MFKWPARRERLPSFARAALIAALFCTATHAVADSAPSQAARARAATRLAGQAASEYWDLVALLDTGHVIVGFFMITNFGPGSGNAFVRGHVITPEGNAYEFHNGRRAARWTLSDDRLRLDVGTSHLDLADEGRLHIDKRKLEIDLQIEWTQPVALPLESSDLNLVDTQLLETAAPVRGRLRATPDGETSEVTGRMAILRSTSSQPEALSVLRRIYAFAPLDAERAVFLLALETPARAWHAFVGTTDSSGGPAVVELVQLTLASSLEGRDARDYPVAKTLHFAGKRMQGVVTLDPVLFETDPLDAFPFAFRPIVRWITKSAPRQLWARARFEGTLRPEQESLRSLQADGVAAVGFANPLSDD